MNQERETKPESVLVIRDSSGKIEGIVAFEDRHNVFFSVQEMTQEKIIQFLQGPKTLKK